MKLLSKTAFKKIIESMKHDELVDFLTNLYSTNFVFQDIMNLELNEVYVEEFFTKACNKITLGFRPTNSFSITDVYNTVKSFPCKKPEVIAELNLHFAACAAEFSCEFGDMDNQYYKMLEKAFLEALEYAASDRCFFIKREEKFEEILHHCACFGWGVYDNLKPVFDDAWEAVIDGDG